MSKLENSFELERAFPGRENRSFDGIKVEVKDYKVLFEILTKPEMKRSGDVYIEQVDLLSPLSHLVGAFNSDEEYFSCEVKVRSEKNFSSKNPLEPRGSKCQSVQVGKGENKPPISSNFLFSEGLLEAILNIGSGGIYGPINMRPLRLSSLSDFEKQMIYFSDKVKRTINFLYGISGVDNFRKTVLLDVVKFQKEFYLPKVPKESPGFLNKVRGFLKA